MLIGYGSYAMSFAIGGSAGGSAFLTSSGNMNDGRIGLVSSMRWISGAQTTSSYVEITVTISDPLDSTAAIGVVGLCNVTGLPAGLEILVSGVTQALNYNALGELNAWFIPQTTGNSLVIRIKNKFGVTAPVAASAIFGIGEIFIGRVISLCTLTNSGTQMAKSLQDPTAFTRTDSGTLYQVMRKPWDEYQATLGPFSTTQAFGGSASNLVSGSNPAGVIDINTLRGVLSRSAVCAVCDISNSGGTGTLVNGIRYDQSFMQGNWIIARPSSPGQIARTMSPYNTWNPVFAKTA